MNPQRGCLTVLGVLLVLVGIPMLVCPGPGLLVIGVGLSLILTGRVVREMEARRPEEGAGPGEIMDVEFEVLDAGAPLPTPEVTEPGQPTEPPPSEE